MTAKELLPSTESSDIHEKLSALDKFETICSHLIPKAPRFTRPTMWHWDIRPGNLFAQDARITGIIDWQDVWIGPYFLQARRPQLVNHHGEMILRLPDEYETMEDPNEKAKVADQVERSILLYCYNLETKGQHEDLDALLDLSQVIQAKHTVTFASDLSDGEVTPLWGCLEKLTRYIFCVC